MTTYITRTPYHQITIDGQTLQLDHGPQVTRGLNMLISECVVRIPYNAGTIVKVDSQVQLFGGLSADAARTRFVGFAERFDDKLWPGELALVCKGALFLTERSRGADPGGSDLSSQTRADVILYVMLRSDVPVSLYGLISDDGTVIGTTAGADDTRFRWMPSESGLSVIQRYDEASVQEDGSAYRVTEDSAGRIISRLYTVIPPSIAAYSYYEAADDMLESSHVVSEDKQAASRSEVKGFGDITFVTSLAVPGNSANFQSPLLESSLISEALGISAERVANGLLASGKYRFITAEIDTHRDDPIGPGDVVYVESARMRVNQTFWVQNVVDTWDENNQFTKKITAVSELGLGTFNRTSAGQSFSTPIITIIQDDLGEELPPDSPYRPNAAMHVLQVIQERVIRAGAATTIYDVSCEDVSTSPASTIASRAWAASGTGAYPTSGTGKYFTVKFDGLVGTITLTATDALGNVSVPTTLDISTFTADQVKARDLFSILQDGGPLGILEAFDGHDMTWRTYATGATTVTLAVANGPCWAVNDTVYHSDDYLRTTPDTSTPDSGNNVVRLWIEPDVNINTVAASLADGQIALSTDAGATWTLKAGPDANPATWIILSRYAAGEIDLFSSTGFWQSPDNGSTWNLIQAGDFTFADLNPFRNWGAAQITGTGKWVQAEGLTAITGTGSDDIRAVTSHIRLDRGYALAADGSTWYLATDGATAATAGADIPGAWSGTVQDDVYRDGGLVDLAYFPFGAGGLGKTTDGFRTTTGYEQLRKRSIDGANAAGDWPMLGVGLLSTVTPAEEGGSDSRIYITGNDKIYVSADGAATWAEIVPMLPADSELRLGEGIGVVKGTSAADDIIYAMGVYSIPSPEYNLYKSVDGGANFARQGPPFNSAFFPAKQVEATDSVTVYTLNNGETGRTTNSGSSYSGLTDSWAAISVTATKIWGYNNSSTTGGDTITTRANLDGSSPTVLTLEAGGDLVFPARAWSDTEALAFGGYDNYPENKLFTINGTTPTDILPPGPFAADCRVMDAITPDGNTIIALLSDDNNFLGGEIWRSPDGGGTWAKVAEDPGLAYSNDQAHPVIAFDPQDSTIWYVWSYSDADGPHLWKSTDDGVTWNDLAPLSFVDMSDDHIHVVGG